MEEESKSVENIDLLRGRFTFGHHSSDLLSIYSRFYVIKLKPSKRKLTKIEFIRDYELLMIQTRNNPLLG